MKPNPQLRGAMTSPRRTRKFTEQHSRNRIMDYHPHLSSVPGAVATGSFRDLPGRYRSRYSTEWQAKSLAKRARIFALVVRIDPFITLSSVSSVKVRIRSAGRTEYFGPG